MDLLTVRIKIIASLGSWGVLFAVIIGCMVSLRKKGMTAQYIPYRTKFRRTKLPKIRLAAENFVRRKVLSAENFVRRNILSTEI